jgi:hypothetical protein
VALTLTAVIVALVSTVFLVQNDFFSRQVVRSVAQDNARGVTDVIASDVRSVMDSGIVVANHRELVVRSPMALAVVCAQIPGPLTTVYLDGGMAALDTSEVSGFGVRDPVTGAWRYYDIPSWGTIESTGGQPANDCVANGADTVGASGGFMRLRKLRSYTGSNPALGTVLMLYRNVEFAFQQSEMDSTAWGLFRGIYGDSLVEFATGMDTASGFWYRTGGSTYASQVTGTSIPLIDAIRVKSEAEERAVTGGEKGITYGWSVNMILRNVK